VQINGKCSCKLGQVFKDGKCEDSKTTNPVIKPPVTTTCAQGLVLVGKECRCPANMRPVNGACALINGNNNTIELIE
jgi:hypothetical protein